MVFPYPGGAEMRVRAWLWASDRAAFRRGRITSVRHGMGEWSLVVSGEKALMDLIIAPVPRGSHSGTGSVAFGH